MGRKPNSEARPDEEGPKERERLPAPTPQFRRRAWREFERALDPLAPPRPLPTRPAEPPR